jgi:asparagine synthase (glutamine-hydrolysing)
VQAELSPAAIRSVGLFDEQRVTGLLRRCEAGRVRGQREAMALVGVLSTQVWFEQFFGGARKRYPEETSRPRVFLDLDRISTMEVAG